MPERCSTRVGLGACVALIVSRVAGGHGGGVTAELHQKGGRLDHPGGEAAAGVQREANASICG
eukprot:5748774-Prymnesium_polylepis.4